MSSTVPRVPGKALGKRPPVDRPALMLSDILTGVVPEVPVAADNFADVSTWEMGGNDRHGTCGPTSVANNLLLVSTHVGSPRTAALDDVYDLYRRSGNPNFNPNLADNDPNQQDDGVIVQEMLSALLSGGIGGYKPLAFAKIAAGDMDTLDKAIALFGGVILGLSLEVAQQTETTWDYKPSADWGGHAVMAGRYSNQSGTTSDRTAVITWAEVMDTTHTFISHQEDEAWVVIWPEHFASKPFLQGVDVSALASAYSDLTGRPFPIYSPPQPPPPPGPGPSDPAVDQALKAAFSRMLSHSWAPHYLRTAAEAWMNAHP